MEMFAARTASVTLWAALNLARVEILSGRQGLYFFNFFSVFIRKCAKSYHGIFIGFNQRMKYLHNNEVFVAFFEEGTLYSINIYFRRITIVV